MMLLHSICSLGALAITASAVSVTVHSDGGNATSPYQYGLMFEDINNSGDGGVYAELVANRAFQGNTIFPSSLNNWTAVGDCSLSLQNLSKPLSSALPTSMRVSGGSGTIGFSNAGFWGFPVVASWEYSGSFWVHGHFNGKVNVCLESDATKESYAEASVTVSSTKDTWTQYNYTFKPSQDAPNSNNTLVFTFPASAMNDNVDFNLLSLFPPTYNNRPNGLRVDLMDAMAGLKPSFFRAPGGNNLEGLQAPYWWNWTNTIGPIRDRPGYPGTWSYQTTDGLGLIEYMLWAQDLGMEPILAVWSGLWLNADSVAEADIEPFVQSALDELEFLMGDASTTWGAKRIELGYPQPFEINFVEVGNEDSLLVGSAASYSAYRFQAFYDAISTAYPNMTIIASYYDVDGATPPYNAAGDFHEYAIPMQMSQQFTYFDNYTSEHPLLIGEYAVIEYNTPNQTGPSWVEGAPRAYFPFWYGSVAEAVFLLGAERNSDKIIGASYAPGFQNLNRWEWIPDTIEFDAYPGHTTLSTSYHVISFLSGTRITENLPMTMSEGEFGPAFWVAGRSSKTGSHILKAAVYNSTSDVPFSVNFEGVGRGASGTLTWLTAPMNASNPVGGNVVQTHKSTVKASRNGFFSFSLPDYSVAILEVSAGPSGYGNPSSRHGWKGWKSWGRDCQNSGKLNQYGQGWW